MGARVGAWIKRPARRAWTRHPSTMHLNSKNSAKMQMDGNNHGPSRMIAIGDGAGCARQCKRGRGMAPTQGQTLEHAQDTRTYELFSPNSRSLENALEWENGVDIGARR